jgi:uncharacterized protein YggE
MISYDKFSADWKTRAAYYATLALGAIAAFLSVFLIAATVRTIVLAGNESDQMYGPSVSVRGVGKVVATSTDIVATFSFGAQATSESVGSAQEESAKIVNAAIAFLKSKGVEDKDIETQSYNIYPKQEWIAEPCVSANYCPGGNYRDVGFTVEQYVKVRVQDTAKAGELLSGIGKLDVTNISGLTFSIEDDEALKDMARQMAIEDAKERAKALGESLDVELVRIVGMYEYQNDPGYPYPMYAERGMAMDASQAVSPDLPVGEQEIEITVEVQYAIED